MRRIIKIALVIIILYIIATRSADDIISLITRDNTTLSTQKHSDSDTSAPIANNSTDNQFQGNFIERSLSKIFANILKTEQGRDAFIKLIHPVNTNHFTSNGICLRTKDPIKSIFDIKDISLLPAAKGPACCGQTVAIKYIITDENSKFITEQAKNLILGAEKPSSVIENIVVGMRIGEIREAVVSSYHLTTADINVDNKSRAYKITVTLNDIESPINIPPHAIRIWDQPDEHYAPPCLCGHKISFDVRISQLDGTIIYDTTAKQQRIEMVVGDKHYPIIFSYALFNKIPSGERIVLAKGEYLRSITSNDENKFMQELNLNINVNEFLILEFLNFTVLNND